MGSYLSYFKPNADTAKHDELNAAIVTLPSDGLNGDEKCPIASNAPEYYKCEEEKKLVTETKSEKETVQNVDEKNETNDRSPPLHFDAEQLGGCVEDCENSVSSTMAMSTGTLTYDEVVEGYNMLYSSNQGISSSLEATYESLDDQVLNISENIEEEIASEETETNDSESQKMDTSIDTNIKNKIVNIVDEKRGDYFFCTFPKCRSKFKNLDNFERHLSTVHDTKYIHQSASTSDSHSETADTNHSSAKPFVCSFVGCKKSYKTKSSFLKHVEAHERSLPLTESGVDELYSSGRRKRTKIESDQCSVSSRSESVGSRSDRSSLCDSTTYQNGKTASKKKRK